MASYEEQDITYVKFYYWDSNIVQDINKSKPLFKLSSPLFLCKSYRGDKFNLV